MDCVSIIFLACIISLIVSLILLIGICSTRKRIADKNRKIEVLSKNILESSTELARTRQLLSEEKITSENKFKENEALFQHVEKLQSHITSDEVKIAHLEAYVKECELKVHDSRDRLDRTKASLDRTKAELSEWKETANKQAEKIQFITAGAGEISSLFDNVIESIEVLKVDINSLDSRLIKLITEE